MLNTGVLALSVLPDSDQVDILESGGEALQTGARPDVSVQAESLPQHQVHRRMAGTNRSHQRSLEPALVLVHALLAVLRNGPLTTPLDSVDVTDLPVDGAVGGFEDFSDRVGDFWADAVAGDEGAGVDWSGWGSSEELFGSLAEHFLVCLGSIDLRFWSGI